MKLRFVCIDLEDRDLIVFDSEKETIKDCLFEFILKRYVPDNKEMILSYFDIEVDDENKTNNVEEVLKEKSEKELLGLIEYICDEESCEGEDDLRLIENLSTNEILFKNNTYIWNLEKY